MSGLLTEYESRVAEILVYFDFLENLLEKDARLHFPRGRKQKFTSCGEELLKILKANAFLLLYNLIESSVRNGVAKIYDAVRTDGLSYTQVCDELRTIWTYQQFVPDEGRKIENNARRLMDLIAFVLDAELISLDARDLPLAGNVDAEQIRIFGAEIWVHLQGLCEVERWISLEEGQGRAKQPRARLQVLCRMWTRSDLRRTSGDSEAGHPVPATGSAGN
jgi:hypothetical protein